MVKWGEEGSASRHGSWAMAGQVFRSHWILVPSSASFCLLTCGWERALFRCWWPHGRGRDQGRGSVAGRDTGAGGLHLPGGGGTSLNELHIRLPLSLLPLLESTSALSEQAHGPQKGVPVGSRVQPCA